MKRYQVLVHGAIPTPGNTVYEDVGADYYELHNGVLVFFQIQEYGKSPIVSIAYNSTQWLTFQEVEE